MLGLKLNHVSKRGHWWFCDWLSLMQICETPRVHWIRFGEYHVLIWPEFPLFLRPITVTLHSPYGKRIVCRLSCARGMWMSNKEIKCLKYLPRQTDAAIKKSVGSNLLLAQMSLIPGYLCKLSLLTVTFVPLTEPSFDKIGQLNLSYA